MADTIAFYVLIALFLLLCAGGLYVRTLFRKQAAEYNQASEVKDRISEAGRRNRGQTRTKGKPGSRAN